VLDHKLRKSHDSLVSTAASYSGWAGLDSEP